MKALSKVHQNTFCFFFVVFVELSGPFLNTSGHLFFFWSNIQSEGYNLVDEAMKGLSGCNRTSSVISCFFFEKIHRVKGTKWLMKLLKPFLRCARTPSGLLHRL